MSPDLIFYDGHCGLCHRSVRLLIAEDRAGTKFRFAPLDGATFRRAIPEVDRSNLPNSFVVVTAAGVVLTRAMAVRHIMQRLGGLWKVVSSAAAMVPTCILDRVYDGIARVRLQLFARPTQICPLVPSHLRERFVD